MLLKLLRGWTIYHTQFEISGTSEKVMQAMQPYSSFTCSTGLAKDFVKPSKARTVPMYAMKMYLLSGLSLTIL